MSSKKSPSVRTKPLSDVLEEKVRKAASTYPLNYGEIDKYIRLYKEQLDIEIAERAKREARVSRILNIAAICVLSIYIPYIVIGFFRILALLACKYL